MFIKERDSGAKGKFTRVKAKHLELPNLKLKGLDELNTSSASSKRTKHN